MLPARHDRRTDLRGTTRKPRPGQYKCSAVSFPRQTAQALALRARIVLTCAEGGQNKEVAAKLGLDRSTVGKWRRRLVGRRVDGLHDEPRSGAPRTVDDACT
ncbi:helix-turn-helix domain-containing protein [Bradyrhizobium sp. S3.5.5]|uniref:helix-turn-helix domain-containing protein n=1 Tax=Bradyrhizobium sp. S3.5.5 TaxID=3156430 RepID=UPI003391338B